MIGMYIHYFWEEVVGGKRPVWLLVEGRRADVISGPKIALSDESP